MRESFFLVKNALVIPFSQKLSFDLFLSHGNHLYVQSQVLIQVCLYLLLKVLNIFPFATVQVGVYKIWTSNLSTGGSWNFRTSSKGGYGPDILIPYFGGVILFSLL